MVTLTYNLQIMTSEIQLFKAFIMLLLGCSCRCEEDSDGKSIPDYLWGDDGGDDDDPCYPYYEEGSNEQSPPDYPSDDDDDY